MTGLETIKTPEALLEAGLIEAEALENLRAVTQRYALAITPSIAGLIDNRDPQDPIARQFVPDAAELLHLPEERDDPIGDDAHSPVHGIVHRYPDRVLFKGSARLPRLLPLLFPPGNGRAAGQWHDEPGRA